VPPTQGGRGNLFFSRNLPSGARCAGRGGKAAEPVHAGPPGVGNHLIAVSDPCRRSTRGEIRDPKPDGASLEPLEPRIAGPGRGGDPRRFLSHGTQVQGQLATWAACYGSKFRSPLEQGSPGRGGVPSRLMSPGTQVHGRLAAWAAGGNGREFRSPLEHGSPGRGKVLSRLLSPGTQVHGRLAARAAGGDGHEFRSPLEQVSPGRGEVLSRLMSPGTQVHGRLAAWEASGDGLEF
jgi:hypothetical protein